MKLAKKTFIKTNHLRTEGFEYGLIKSKAGAFDLIIDNLFAMAIKLILKYYFSLIFCVWLCMWLDLWPVLTVGKRSNRARHRSS